MEENVLNLEGIENSVQIRRNLNRWYFEYSVINGFSVDKIKEYFVINGISDGRINIAGGEPFLYQGLGELIEYINEKGIEVSIITNGFLLTSNFIQQYKDKISMIGISVDSLDEEMCINLGRCTINRKTLNFKKIVDLGREIKFNGIMLKYNIVLTKLNCKESVEKFKELFLKTWPDRIKLIPVFRKVH